ncbi:MAG: Asp23/Gls24 family envelope stress response protein [Defluviitaleaceae bacterium]|nr:Asp23/Gls24 family envelope stress response protein [Defluviitaleaceae bacterium]
MTKTQHGSDKGKVQIANDVVATISATAALEIEGVFSMASYAGGIPVFVRKNMSKGVKVTIAGDEVVLDLNIVVRFGYRILEVSESVQARVKNAVQTMTGLNVRSVNVVVSSVYLEKEKEAAPRTTRKDKRPKPEAKQPDSQSVVDADKADSDNADANQSESSSQA